MSKDQGGCAFPRQAVLKSDDREHIGGAAGIWAREYYAIKILSGLVNESTRTSDAEHLSQIAFALADAFIKEGKK